MIATEAIAGPAIRVTYSDDVNAGDFSLVDFAQGGTGQTPTTISNDSSAVLLLEFDDPLDLPGDLTYTGSVTGVLTPQTIGVT